MSKNMKEEGCIERVPDHTDFYTCHAPVLRGGYCANHIKDAEERARDRVRKLETQLKVAREKLSELTSESGVVER